MTKNVVLIHGAFCGGWCFADIMPTLAQRGWSCQAPDLPFHVPGPARTPDPQLAKQSIADYTRDMAAFVARLPEPPVIVGHSMGGLIAQQLAAQGLARALVLLAPGGAVGRAAVDASRDDAGQGPDAGLALLGQGAQPIVRGGEGGFARQPRSASAAAHLRHVQRRVRARPVRAVLLDVRPATHDRRRRRQGDVPGAGRLRLATTR